MLPVRNEKCVRKNKTFNRFLEKKANQETTKGERQSGRKKALVSAASVTGSLKQFRV